MEDPTSTWTPYIRHPDHTVLQVGPDGLLLLEVIPVTPTGFRYQIHTHAYRLTPDLTCYPTRQLAQQAALLEARCLLLEALDIPSLAPSPPPSGFPIYWEDWLTFACFLILLALWIVWPPR